VTSFDHEKLAVYQAAIDFVGLADDLIEAFPRGRAYLADQLQRAATSIALNIAEGAGEYSRGDKARFYRMALRSATECAALLDVLGRLKLGEVERLTRGHDALVGIVSMLTRMVLNLEGRSGKGMGKGKGEDA
jgi:four helix bundle protein